MKTRVILLIVFFISIINLQCSKNELYIVKSKGGLRVRSGPSVNNKKLTVIPNNSEIIVTEFSDHTDTIYEITAPWAKIKYKNYSGWVFSGLIYKKKTVGDNIFSGIHFLYFLSIIIILTIAGAIIFNKKLNINISEKLRHFTQKLKSYNTNNTADTIEKNQKKTDNAKTKISPIARKRIVVSTFIIFLIAVVILLAKINYVNIQIFRFNQNQKTLVKVLIINNKVSSKDEEYFISRCSSYYNMISETSTTDPDLSELINLNKLICKDAKIIHKFNKNFKNHIVTDLFKILVFDKFPSISKYTKTLRNIERYNESVKKYKKVTKIVYERYKDEIQLLNNLDYDQIQYYFENGYPKFQFHL